MTTKTPPKLFITLKNYFNSLIKIIKIKSTWEPEMLTLLSKQTIQPNILLIEGDPLISSKFQNALSGIEEVKANLTQISDPEQAIDHLKKFEFDVIFINSDLLIDSTVIVSHVKAIQDKPLVVLLTDSHKAFNPIDILKLGAQDYLVKQELNENLLWRCIRYGLEKKLIQDELNRTQERLQELVCAMTYQLTK